MLEQRARNDILYVNRFITGLHTNRSPLVSPTDGNDAVIDGSNMELGDDLVWRRRAGISKFFTGQLSAGEIPRRFYTWRSFSAIEGLFIDLTNTVKVFDFSGNLLGTVSISGGAGVASFVSIGDTTYIANGSDRKKYHKTAGSSGWGISTPVTATSISLTAGSLSPTVGYRWVYCFKNNTSLHISTASPPSASSGPQTSQNFILGGERSTDTQVDKVEIYRTKDGGSTYYFVAVIDNPGAGSWSYTDSTTDANLNTGKTAPLNYLNDPPPVGLKNICFHVGHVWGSTGNKVYYNSGSAVLNGVPEESWYPLNYFSFPGTVIYILPLQSGMAVFTATDTYLIRGITAGEFYPQIWLPGTGILSPLGACLFGGTLYLFTTGRQLLGISDQMTNPGFAIGNTQLNGINPALVSLTVHQNTDKDLALYLCDGAGKIQRASLALRAWSTPGTISGLGIITSVETSSGTFALLMGKTIAAQYIYQRDLTVSADDSTPFSPYLTFGSLMLAPPTHLADVASVLIERTAAGTQPTVAILPNEISGSFITLPDPVDEPPQLPATTTVIAKRYYLKAAATPIPEKMRHLQLKLTWATEAAANELYGFAVSVPRVQ
jgi:hypothetical protein